MRDLGFTDFDPSLWFDRPLVEICAGAAGINSESSASTFAFDALRTVAFDRVLTVLRTFARDQIAVEAANVDRFLATDKGIELAKREPRFVETLRTCVDLLGVAAERSGPADLKSILKGRDGRTRRVFDLVIQATSSVSLSTLQTETGFTRSELVYSIHDLEEAALIDHTIVDDEVTFVRGSRADLGEAESSSG